MRWLAQYIGAHLALIGVALLLAFALSGCATRPALPVEPVVQTVEVAVPVSVPCPAIAAIGAPLPYPDTPAALQAAADIFERVKLLLAGRELRNARLAATEKALEVCG